MHMKLTLGQDSMVFGGKKESNTETTLEGYQFFPGPLIQMSPKCLPSIPPGSIYGGEFT